MTSFSDAKGRKVVSIATSGTVGKVADFIVDAQQGRIAAVALKKTPGKGDIVVWRDIAAFGEDAVTVADESSITAADAEVARLGDRAFQLHGKRVLTTLGQELGDVKDLEFDPATGTVLQLLLKNGDVAGVRLLSVGSYAVVVRPE